MDGPLKIGVTEHGQPYYDELVPEKNRGRANTDVLRSKVSTASVAAALGGEIPRPITVRTRRVPLRWVKP